MNERTILITGASDGIGAAAAADLAASGSTVVVVGHSPEKTRAVALNLGVGSYSVNFAVLDDVRRLADELRRDLPRIDVLVNNAGAIFAKRELTVDGHERTMQVNHLAPFLLTNLLLDMLIASQATVINTSSAAHRVFARFRVDDLELAHGYTSRIAYGNAKLENILFARELHRRFNDRGISSAAFHPGVVATNFASETNGLMRFVYRTPLRRMLLISPSKAAETLVWLATTMPGVEWKSGEYYYNQRVATSTAQARDPELAAKLWDRSAKLCGL